MANFVSVVCALFYVIFIVYGIIKKKKINDMMIDDIEKNICAGEVAHIILKQNNMLSNEQLEVDDSFDFVDDEENEDDYEGGNAENEHRFKFEAHNDVVEHRFEFENNDILQKDVVDEKSVFPGVYRIDDDVYTYGIDGQHGQVELSSDIYDSNSVTSVGISAYETCKLILTNNKPFRYSLISFITCIPRLIVQIGWIFCILYFVGMFDFSDKVVIIGSSVIIVSMLLNCLNLFFFQYISDFSCLNLLNNEIINDNELETVGMVTDSLAAIEILSCFGFLKFFLKKFMGYQI